MNSNSTVKAVIFWILVCVMAAPHARTRQFKLKKMVIHGNQTFNTSELKTLMELKKVWLLATPKYTASKLRSDISMLEKFYRSQGFFAVDITKSVKCDSSRYNVFIDLNINEGQRTCISKIQITSKRSILDNQIVQKLKSKPLKPLILPSIDSDVELLRSTLAAKGFLKASVKYELSVDSSKLNSMITFVINEGPLISVDTVKLKGNNHVHSKVLIRELGLSKGDTLTSKKIRKAEQQLYRTNLFSFAQISPFLGDTTDTLDISSLPDSNYRVNVIVQQADFFRVEGGVGYGTAERFRASLQSSYANMFNVGHSLTFKGKYSKIVQEAEVVYGVPWLFSLPLQFNSSIYWNRRDDLEKTYFGIFRGARFSVGRNTSFNLAYQFFIDWEEVNRLEAKNDSLLPELPTKSFGSRISYDTRNDMINPTSGIFNSFETEISGLMGHSNQFLKISNDFRIYHKTGPFVFGTSVKSGWVRTYGKSTTIPPQERFYAGGARSIRGFSENILKADLLGDKQDVNYMLTANLIDIRFPIFWWFNGAVFVDAGNVWHTIANRNVFKDLRWSAGPGIRLNTPIAVVRFDVGFKLNQRPGESRYEFHFDLGQPF